MRMKLKRANVTELKREERAFKKRQERNARNRKKYREKHPPRKSKNGKRIGRPHKRKNEKFEPKKLSNGETKADLLTHVRYPLMKSPNNWTELRYLVSGAGAIHGEFPLRAPINRQLSEDYQPSERISPDHA